jgi:hypothetical protein
MFCEGYKNQEVISDLSMEGYNERLWKMDRIGERRRLV